MDHILEKQEILESQYARIKTRLTEWLEIRERLDELERELDELAVEFGELQDLLYRYRPREYVEAVLLVLRVLKQEKDAPDRALQLTSLEKTIQEWHDNYDFFVEERLKYSTSKEKARLLGEILD